MSIQLAHPPLPGETPFEWADRVRGYYPAAKPAARKRRRPAAVTSAKPARRLAVVRRGVVRCVYCGAPSTRRACHAHRDLILLDPLFTALKAEPAEDVYPDVLPDRLQLIGG